MRGDGRSLSSDDRFPRTFELAEFALPICNFQVIIIIIYRAVLVAVHIIDQPSRTAFYQSFPLGLRQVFVVDVRSDIIRLRKTLSALLARVQAAVPPGRLLRQDHRRGGARVPILQQFQIEVRGRTTVAVIGEEVRVVRSEVVALVSQVPEAFWANGALSRMRG